MCVCVCTKVYIYITTPPFFPLPPPKNKTIGLAPPSLALQTVVAHGVDTLVVVPAMLSALLDAMETEKEKKKEQQRGETGAGVRFVLVGGQPLTEGLWRRCVCGVVLVDLYVYGSIDR